MHSYPTILTNGEEAIAIYKKYSKIVNSYKRAFSEIIRLLKYKKNKEEKYIIHIEK